MNVMFSNGEVPIWKLKIGVVVLYETIENDYYVHIKAITNKGRKLIVTVSNAVQEMQVSPEALTWLEPF